jgi:hypothetical protein
VPGFAWRCFFGRESLGEGHAAEAQAVSRTYPEASSRPVTGGVVNCQEETNPTHPLFVAAYEAEQQLGSCFVSLLLHTLGYNSRASEPLTRTVSHVSL